MVFRSACDRSPALTLWNRRLPATTTGPNLYAEAYNREHASLPPGV